VAAAKFMPNAEAFEMIHKRCVSANLRALRQIC
jgi:hypothetical protein